MTDPVKASNWGLLGHDWAVDMLKQQIVEDRLRHAYLFSGPPGLGRRTLALRFAEALNCPQPVSPGQPCGICRDCRQIKDMRHADLSIVQADNEGGTLRVEQVREVRRALMLRPYQSKYRIALFLRFQEANPNAANALLKMLEEAPQHAVLILTADNPEQLLPTITSRCEILRLRPLPVETIESYLSSKGVGADLARLVAHISNGRPGYALHLVENKSALEFRSERLDELQGLLSATRVEKFKFAEKLAREKGFMRETLLIWMSFWRDVLLRVSGSRIAISNIDYDDQIKLLARQLDLDQVRRTVADLDKAVERLESYVNAKLLAEVVLLNLPRV